MCLYTLEEFPPANEGYQVKMKTPEGMYVSLFFNSKIGSRKRKFYPDQAMGKSYSAVNDKAIVFWTKGGLYHYKPGFHVFHDLEGAEEYRKYISFWPIRGKTVIVKVRCDGHKTTGWQSTARSREFWQLHKFRVTVTEKITLLEEVG